MSRYSDLKDRHELLVERANLFQKSIISIQDKANQEPTLSVPVVDEDGERVFGMTGGFDHIPIRQRPKYKGITLRQAFDALEEMCGVEITYQEIKGTSKVVIYEKD